jgi:hypothetical protein
MSTRSALSPRVAGLGVCTLLAMFIVPCAAAAQQPLSPVQIEAERSASENARADTLEEWARALYSTPSRIREAAQLHQRAAMIRGNDVRAVASYRSAAWAYSAAGNNGLATKLMVKAAEQAAMAGRIEEAANAYVDAALIAVAANREDKVPALLTRMHAVLSAPLLPDDRRAKILERIESNSRVAKLDSGQRVEP